MGGRVRIGIVAVLWTLLTLGLVVPASATNKGSVSSDTVSACSLSWTASAVNNTALTNDDATYPNLMVDLAGNPVDYSNGGYIKEVSPALGDAGVLEMQHFYIGASTMVFRIPLATQYATAGGTMTVTLPPGYTYTPAVLTGWDYIAKVYGVQTPPKYMAATVTPTITGSGNVFTVSYPAMPTNSHAYPVAFSANIGTDGTAVNRVATATYKATYVQGGAPTCPVSVPDAPVPAPTSVCQAYLTGHTVFPVLSGDITVREKWDNYGPIFLSGWTSLRTSPAPLGEINADGWGMPNPTFRLYAAADVALTGVDLTWTAAQGFTFKPGTYTVLTASASGMGQLPGNGYTVAATGIGTPTLSADGKSITLHIASMPAKSSVALGVGALLDGSGEALVINETMIGAMTDQSACMPIPQVEVDIAASGSYQAGQTVTFTTTVTNPGSVPVKPELTVSNTTGITYVSGDTDGDGLVDPGESWVYTSTHLVTDADVTAGTVPAKATVTGSDGYPITPDPTASATAEVPTVSSLVKVDMAADGTYESGQTVTFTTTVTNPGQVSYTPDRSVANTTGLTYVSGDADGDGLLDPGESWVYTSTHVVTDADVTAGTVTATATVTGVDGIALTLDPTDSDTAAVQTIVHVATPTPTATPTTGDPTPTSTQQPCADCQVIDSGNPGPSPLLLGLGAALVLAGAGVGVRARLTR